MAQQAHISKLHGYCLLFMIGIGSCFWFWPANPVLFAQKKNATPKQGDPSKGNTPAAQPQSKFKAIWEPVNYKEDLQFWDVFFVNDLVGWVSGGVKGAGGGVILGTRDGGDNWTVQLGDSKSQEGVYSELRFLDEKHGWVVQGSNLLRTTDGEIWEQIGQIAHHHGGYQFTSATTGFYISGDVIYRTQDGGRKWQKIYGCQPRTEVNGLMRNIDCSLRSLHFPTPSTGYALGKSYDVGSTAIITKTVDGGATWQTILAPETGSPEQICFNRENTGFFSVYGGRVFATTDGGETWRGVAVQTTGKIKFADAEVGWSFWDALIFTTDGGKRWTSRKFAFPAAINAFSLPRRDRGYVVGEHGMIYRYRTVPVDYTSRGMIPAPMMPGT